MIIKVIIIIYFALAMVAKPVQAGVLWDQPLSTVNQNSYVDQMFPGSPGHSSFLADDFTNATPWTISNIFVPSSGWNGFSTLSNANSLNFLIYSDDSGIPAGYPSSGSSPQWSISLLPADSQITIDTGIHGYLSNVTLDLTTALSLRRDLVIYLYEEMSFSFYGQYGRQPSDTLNGYIGKFINPGGALWVWA